MGVLPGGVHGGHGWVLGRERDITVSSIESSISTYKVGKHIERVNYEELSMIN